MKKMVADHILAVMHSPIVEIYAAVKDREKMISFGQGVPFFTPTKDILADFFESVDPDPYIHQYSPDPGLDVVRKIVAKYLSKRYSMPIPWKNVLLTNGANAAFFYLVSTLLNPGEEIIIPTPYYFNHYMAIQIAHGKPVEVQTTKEFQLSPSLIQRSISPKTKAIISVNPNNPTGAVYKKDVIHDVVELCNDHDIFLISDETYFEFTYDDVSVESPFALNPEKTILIGSFSKVFGISGWRLGYIVLPSELIPEFLKVEDTIGIAAPTISQLFVAYLLEKNIDLLAKHRHSLEKSRKLFIKLLTESDFFDPIVTKGAYYLFSRLQHPLSSHEFAIKLAQKENVVIIPGTAFGENYTKYVRFSYGNATEKVILEGFDRINRFAKEN